MSAVGEPGSDDVPEIGDYRLNDAEPPDRRRRGWIPVVAALVTGAVVASGLVVHGALSGSSRQPTSAAGTPSVVGGSSAPSPSAPVSSAPVSSGPVSGPVSSGNDAYVVRKGSVIQGSGRVVAVPGKAVRFCAPVPEAAVGYLPGHEPRPAWCPIGVDVVGVDLARLVQPRTKAGATEGLAFLRGTYEGGVLHVTQQTEPRSSPFDVFPEINPSDCPARPGGWQRVPSGSNPSDGLQTLVEKFKTAHPGQVVTEAVARPNAHALYLVLTVADVPLAQKELPVRPGYLCVLPARWTRAQIDAAKRPWESAMPQHAEDPGPGFYQAGEGVWGIGESVDAEAQSSVEVQLVMVTPDFAELADAAPAGLVHLQPWLVPVSTSAPLPSLPVTAPVDTFSTAPESATSPVPSS